MCNTSPKCKRGKNRRKPRRCRSSLALRTSVPGADWWQSYYALRVRRFRRSAGDRRDRDLRRQAVGEGPDHVRAPAGHEGADGGRGDCGGKFSIPAAGGTFAGKFRVEITASRPSGKKVADRFTGKLVDSYEQFIPRKYNTESQLTADVKAGAENRFEFAVNSK